MWDVRDAEYSIQGMLGMWDVGMWNVEDVGFSECRLFGMWKLGMWDVQNVGCLGHGCSGCGMFAM